MLAITDSRGACGRVLHFLKMNTYNQFGDSKIAVSRFGLGTMNFGTSVDQTMANTLLDSALACGINLIDTAETYPFPPAHNHHGMSEKYIGQWLKKSRKREDIVLVGKIAGPSSHLGYLRDGSLQFDKKNICASINESLSRLGTDYLDVAMLHWPARATNALGQLDYKPALKETSQSAIEAAIHGTIVALTELIEVGKIRTFGLSNETPWGVMRFLEIARRGSLSTPSGLQQRYSLLDRSLDIGLAEIVDREGLGLMTYSPLAFGLLSATAHDQSGGIRANSRLASTRKIHRYLNDASRESARQYFALAGENQLDLSQMAIAYLLTRRYVTSVLIGASNGTQLANNVRALDLILDKKILNAIDKIHYQRPNPCL